MALHETNRTRVFQPLFVRLNKEREREREARAKENKTRTKIIAAFCGLGVSRKPWPQEGVVGAYTTELLESNSRKKIII
jgi:hypothetical protein